MSQESMRIKSEDKKAFGKFAAYMAAALIIGVLLGVGMGFAKLNGMDMTGHTVLNAIFFALPYGIPVVTLFILVVVAVIYHRSKKVFLAWNGEDEECMDAVEKQLSCALWLSSINMIWNFCLFGMGFCLDNAESMEVHYELETSMLLIGVFVAGLIILTIEQQKLVNLTKEINPEKKGSIYDVKFQKKWEASCDEAELFAIYKSAYRSYCITQRLCIILWLFCIIGGFVWGFGAVPVLLVSIIWGTMITSYSYYAIHLSN
ncbi:DUF3169 family protein [Roseburia sp. BX1005]|uniref:DUF3169 family protein n=1 Tax=Roseburia zhanii TaxID=2763064 RepID=A0A923LPL1_9FIRM|nr:DUF3169 family protein [Roseburia zhanii]MBC5714779.1 DUF3169 family protein [Roseburia zhanii]